MPKLYEQNNLSAKGKLIPASEFVPFAGTSFDKNNVDFPYVIPLEEELLAHIDKHTPDFSPVCEANYPEGSFPHEDGYLL